MSSTSLTAKQSTVLQELARADLRRIDLSMTRARVSDGDYRLSWYVLNPEMALDRESIIVHRDGTISAVP